LNVLQEDSTMARVPYIDPHALPDNYDILDKESDNLPDSVDEEYWNSAKTVRAFANNPELADLHVHANVSLWTQTGLSPAEVELVILVVARELDSTYVWHAHAITAVERAGVSMNTIIAISKRNFKNLNEKERCLSKYVSEFVRATGVIDDSTHQELASFYEEDSIVGIAMLAGFYLHLHHVATALEIDREEEFVGWELENFPSEHDRYIDE
jgi:alkylhydroperoxidase family enzyme